jgi:hypothetical protein
MDSQGVKGLGSGSMAILFPPPAPTPAPKAKDPEVESDNERAANEWPSIEYHQCLGVSEVTGISDLATVRILLSTTEGRAILRSERRREGDRKAELRKAGVAARKSELENSAAWERFIAAEKRYQELGDN